MLKPKTTSEGKDHDPSDEGHDENAITCEQLLALLQGDDAMRALVQTMVQEVLEAEMEEALGAAKGERTGERRGYYGRN